MNAPAVKHPVCRVCLGRGYIQCECWPGDCICGHGEQDCEYCDGTGDDWSDESDKYVREGGEG